jgi:hypothetical protein
MDEVFYYDGHWYVAKEPEFVLPPFEFDFDADLSKTRMMRDWQWSLGIAPPPLSPIIVTGV